MERLTRTDINTEKQLNKEIIKISKANPTKHATYYVTFGKAFGQFKVQIFIHNRKPQSGTTGGAEETYQEHGGFFKNGEIVKPSATFIKRFEFCPVSRQKLTLLSCQSADLERK